MSQSNLYKSPEGWVRFHEKRDSGITPRRAKMDHRVQSTLPKWDGIVPEAEGETEKPRRRRKRRVTAPNGRTF